MQVDQEQSDAELITLYRSGDEAAAAGLYKRHHRAAWRFAVSIAGHSDADDLASESFIRVLGAIRNGHGPDVAFRPYLMTTVRNTFVNAVRRDGRYLWVEDYSGVEKQTPTDNTMELRNESSLLAQAFRSLPERWQTVLWHTTIEHDSHDEVGRVLGISPSAVAALSYRAREGLRQAYLAVHLAQTSDLTCQRVREQLPAYVRDQLSARATAEAEAHLDDCAACAAVLVDLRGVTSDLGAVLAPALLGAVAGTAYLAQPRRPSLRHPSRSRLSIAAGVGIAAAAAVLVGATAFGGPDDSPRVAVADRPVAAAQTPAWVPTPSPVEALPAAVTSAAPPLPPVDDLTSRPTPPVPSPADRALQRRAGPPPDASRRVPSVPVPAVPITQDPPAPPLIPPALAGELVVNGGAEDGAAGWDAGLVSRIYGADGYPGPILLTDPVGTIPDAGERFFSGTNAASAAATQTIDLSAAAEAIDRGAVVADLSAYLGGYANQNDRGQVTYQFRDGDGNPVGDSVTLSAVTNIDRNNTDGYLLRTASTTIPPGVRDVTVVFETFRSAGTANDGYADNISLRLSAHA